MHDYHHTSHKPSLTVTHLRRGSAYRATTGNRTEVGVFLGLETAWGDRAILLRNGAGTSSIRLREITSLAVAAA